MERDRSGPDTGRARFVVSYRGPAFHGAARNPGVRSVVGDIAAAIARVIGDEPTITLAGRTDAGVHALGQVISLDLPRSLDLDDLARRVTRMCAPDLALRDPEWVEPDFDARFSATARTYRYHLWNDPTPNPLLHQMVWHVPSALDLAAMDRAGRELLGEHDFSSFCRRPDTAGWEIGAVSMVRRILALEVSGSDPLGSGRDALVTVRITGTAFCHQMVRSIVGTLVDIGRGRLPGGAMPGILAARDRSAAGQVAPADGLVLWSVDYSGRRWDDDQGGPDTLVKT
ncbi:MAG: tRNA pseudouridine synthase [Actinomycetota bacterium]